MPDSTSEPQGWWARYRHEAVPGSPARVTLTGVASAVHPWGSQVGQPDDRRPPGWTLSVLHDEDGGRVHRVVVNQPDVPLLWFVEVEEPDAEPAASTLLAFSDDRFDHGTVLTEDVARAAGVRGEQQVAAVRWWTASGVVHQLFVTPRHRRKGIGIALVTAAFGVQAAHGRSAMLHGDGRRTDDGEAWRAGLTEHQQHWFEPWSQRLPSMDPAVDSSPT